MSAKTELEDKRFKEFMKNNPGFSGSYPQKLKIEVEDKGLTHYRENLDEVYRPWKGKGLSSGEIEEMHKYEQILAHMSPEEIEALEQQKSGYISQSRAKAAASDAILPLLLEQIAGNMDYGYSPHIPSLTNPNASRLLEILGDGPVQGGLPGGEITTPKTETPFNPELMYQEGGQVPNNEDFNLVDFYNSLEQNYKESPEGEAIEAGGEPILDYLMREGPGIAKSGAKTGVNALADFLLNPAGFKGSHELLSGESGNTMIDRLIEHFSNSEPYIAPGMLGNQKVY